MHNGAVNGKGDQMSDKNTVEIFDDVIKMFNGILENFQLDADIEFVTQGYNSNELDKFERIMRYVDLNYAVDELGLDKEFTHE